MKNVGLPESLVILVDFDNFSSSQEKACMVVRCLSILYIYLNHSIWKQITKSLWSTGIFVLNISSECDLKGTSMWQRETTSFEYPSTLVFILKTQYALEYSPDHQQYIGVVM